MTARAIKCSTDVRALKSFIRFVEVCWRHRWHFQNSLPDMLDRQELAINRLNQLV